MDINNAGWGAGGGIMGRYLRLSGLTARQADTSVAMPTLPTTGIPLMVRRMCKTRLSRRFTAGTLTRIRKPLSTAKST